MYHSKWRTNHPYRVAHTASRPSNLYCIFCRHCDSRIQKVQEFYISLCFLIWQSEILAKYYHTHTLANVVVALMTGTVNLWDKSLTRVALFVCVCCVVCACFCKYSKCLCSFHSYCPSMKIVKICSYISVSSCVRLETANKPHCSSNDSKKKIKKNIQTFFMNHKNNRIFRRKP